MAPRKSLPENSIEKPPSPAPHSLPGGVWAGDLVWGKALPVSWGKGCQVVGAAGPALDRR